MWVGVDACVWEGGCGWVTWCWWVVGGGWCNWLWVWVVGVGVAGACVCVWGGGGVKACYPKFDTHTLGEGGFTYTAHVVGGRLGDNDGV